MKKSFCAATLAAILVAGAAQAQPFQGVYVGAGAGYNLPQNITVGTPLPTNPRTQLNTQGGVSAVGSIGYGFGNGMRLELEGNYRSIGVRSVSGAAGAPVSGSLSTYGVMVNALFDMDIALPWVYPYLGGGVGYAWTNVNTLAFGGATGLTTNGTQGRFAAQAIAGLSFPMPGVPGLSLTSEYRFLGAIGNASYGSTVTATGRPTTVTLQNQYNHSFMLGVRYAFGVQPPPEPPAPAPAPAAQAARSYLVFFDWDKATLSDRARAVIREAAESSTRVSYTRIEVNGYTDTSGSPKHNMGLSLRRAQAVAAELVRNKVPKEAIAIQGFGETKPLVPTGPNVREPQNRRVEIIIR